MTLPKDVQDARGELDAAHDQRFAPWRNQWQTIRAHLLSQDAEVARLNAECMQHLRQAMENGGRANQAESRLAAADALLREAVPFIDPMWDDSSAFIGRVNAHLSENPHG